MNHIRSIFRRELGSYFATPLAYVFVLIFLVAASAMAFQLGRLFERGQADLQPFFTFHPWLYLLLVPAVAMRLWAEERRSGTIELLLTQPITLWQAVMGKFLAAWAFIGIALALTFPIWITVDYLGKPDNGAIATAYFGSLLMAGGFLAVGSCMSALTRNQVVAFVLAVAVCFVLLLIGYPAVLDAVTGWAPSLLTDTLASLSVYTHFESLQKGVIDLRDVLFYLLLIGFFLAATCVVLDARRGDV
jgi:ABC-2 type transport system permease protein